MRGRTRRAASPMWRSLTGTLRQPRSRHPCDLAMSSISSSTARCCARPRGRKIMPTPYCPESGIAMCVFAQAARRNACGTWKRTPEPSLVPASLPTALRCSRFSRSSSALRMTSWDRNALLLLENLEHRSAVGSDAGTSDGSLPTALRCSRFSRSSSALRMTSWDRAPRRCATNPMPHPSCSWAGSYSPCAAGSPAAPVRILPGIRSHCAGPGSFYKEESQDLLSLRVTNPLLGITVERLSGITVEGLTQTRPIEPMSADELLCCCLLTNHFIGVDRLDRSLLASNRRHSGLHQRFAASSLGPDWN